MTSGKKHEKRLIQVYHSLLYRTKKQTNQGNAQGKEPGVDEEVVTTDLNDVEQQRGHWQQDALGHSKFLHRVLQEKSQRLNGTQTGRNIKGKSAMGPHGNI